MTMLYQIEKNLEAIKTEKEMQKKDAEAIRNAKGASGSKVVAVSVDPELYEMLQGVARKHGVNGVRGALGLAARVGLRYL